MSFFKVVRALQWKDWRLEVWKGQKRPKITGKLRISDGFTPKIIPHQRERLSSAAGFNSKLTSNPSNYNECSPLRFNVTCLWMISEIRKDKTLWNTKRESGFSLFGCLSSHSLLHIHHWWNLDQNVLYKCTQRLNAEVKPSDRGIYFIMVSELTRINSPDAQSSSSAPFSQSFSPSHLHDNETHLLVDPPQSNFSGGHVCLPVGRDKRDREITVVLWSIKATTTTIRRHSWTWFLSPPQCS